jgi:DNA-binding NtrC family response regulator
LAISRYLHLRGIRKRIGVGMRKILSVDDDKGVLECLKATLEAKGYEVITTSNPSQAASIMREQELCLVLLDIRMPEKNGFEIFTELKKRYHELPVMFVTGYPKSFSMETEGVTDMLQKEFADGNTDILYKPFKPAVLYEKVEALIGSPEEQE